MNLFERLWNLIQDSIESERGKAQARKAFAVGDLVWVLPCQIFGAREPAVITKIVGEPRETFRMIEVDRHPGGLLWPEQLEPRKEQP